MLKFLVKSLLFIYKDSMTSRIYLVKKNKIKSLRYNQVGRTNLKRIWNLYRKDKCVRAGLSSKE